MQRRQHLLFRCSVCNFRPFLLVICSRRLQQVVRPCMNTILQSQNPIRVAERERTQDVKDAFVSRSRRSPLDFTQGKFKLVDS